MVVEGPCALWALLEVISLPPFIFFDPFDILGSQFGFSPSDFEAFMYRRDP